MAQASQLPEQAATCRDLARRARRLAGTLLDGPDRDRLLQYVDEMEQRTGELERGPVTQPQQQVQQRK
jgi:hypothetical protein